MRATGHDRRGRNRLGQATAEHPLLGGLRIGKEHEEEHPDGDGQYFHYLTKWMFALNRMSLATSNPAFNAQAVELAQAVFPHFVTKRDSDRPRMYWKISIDMSKPVVSSEGYQCCTTSVLEWLRLARAALQLHAVLTRMQESGPVRRVCHLSFAAGYRPRQTGLGK